MACTKCEGKSYRTESRGEFSLAFVCDCTKTCKRCGGKGFLQVSLEQTFSEKVGPKSYDVLAPCMCRLLEGRVARFNDARIPGKHAKASFDNYVVGFASQDRAKKVGLSFATGYRKGQQNKGYILSGTVGTGKTHLLCATLSHLMLEVGVPVQYVEISLLYATIRRGFQEGKSGGEIIEPLSKVEVLAIDELGKGRGSQFELETLDELIARRYNAGRTTLFATNYSLAPEKKSVKVAGPRSSEELKGAGKDSELLRERVTERIYSRLCEMCEFVELGVDLPDYRRAAADARPARYR
ncbi:MAG: ATP-binding protein [Myxococcaceae bacterium]